MRGLWDAALAAGAAPAGLGARDTLRLEVGLPLYGHELGPDRNAAQSGFTRALSPVKPYIGSEKVRGADPPRETLVGIRFEGRRTARAGDEVLDGGGNAAGRITSGSYGPSVGCALALAVVRREAAVVGTVVRARTPRAEIEGVVVELPFYRGGTVRC